MSEWIRNRKRTDGYPKGLEEGTKIEARFRGGSKAIGIVGMAPFSDKFFDASDGLNGDIMAYRLIEDEPAVTEKTPYQKLCEKHGVAEDAEWEITNTDGGMDSFATVSDIVTLATDDGTGVPFFRCGLNGVFVSLHRLMPINKNPAKIAPKLWAAYKDVLNDEALAALRDVICEQWGKIPSPEFGVATPAIDVGDIIHAFAWAETTQGEPFWDSVYSGKYNKPTTALELQDAEIGIPAPVNEIVYSTEQPELKVSHVSMDSKPSASNFLEAANKTISQRGDDYDKPEGERSAESVAAAFNSITKRDLTEAEIWLVLQLVKDVRQWQNPERFHYDSALDCVAYAALKGEALAK